MKNKNVPIRKCFLTRERLFKNELLRIVKNKNGEIFFDIFGKMEGRGLYFKKNMEIVNKVVKNDILSKKLKCTVSKNIYEQIINYMNGSNYDEK